MLGQFLQLRDVVRCLGSMVSRAEHHRYSPYSAPIGVVSADPWPHHVRLPVRGPAVRRSGAPTRIATRCSQFRHSASRGSKGSMPSSLRTLGSTTCRARLALATMVRPWGNAPPNAAASTGAKAPDRRRLSERRRKDTSPFEERVERPLSLQRAQ
jgi:hypothetical protein